jgi:hypothetical protein
MAEVVKKKPERAELEQLKASIDVLNDLQHQEIFNILKQHSTKYSSGANGVFVVDKDIPPPAYEEIQKYVRFCYDLKAKGI